MPSRSTAHERTSQPTQEADFIGRGIGAGILAVKFAWTHRHRPVRHRHDTYSFTGYEVSGYSSTFGPPDEAAGTTADGGTDGRPCFAIRNDATLHHNFLVTIGHHSIVAEDCDWGPATYTGRNIDFTGTLLERMGINPRAYDNGTATVRELSSRRP